MPSPDLLFAFMASAIVFAYVPGPSMLYAAAQTLALGRRGGATAALGIHLGGYVHVALVALGIAALLDAFPMLFGVITFVGSAYLIGLGVNVIRSQLAAPLDTTAVPKQTRKALLNSALVEILNPKTAIFYLAFLPQFTDPNGSLSIAIQLAVLGTIVNILFSSADILCVLFAERLSASFATTERSRRLLSYLAGVILIVIGVHLFTS